MKLLFNATELSYFEEKSGHRAGVFYVALNLFKEFKKAGIEITFTCDYKRYFFLKKMKEFSDIKLLNENSLFNLFLGKIVYLTRNFPIHFKYALLILLRFYEKYLYKVNIKNTKQLFDFDIYFSPVTPSSKEIEQSNLKRFRMIHDIIPILENGMTKSPKDWYYKIYSTINSQDFYLTNSEYTKKDVLKYFPFIKEENIKTTLLGANENFKPVRDETILKKYNLPQKYIFSLCSLGKRKNLIFGIKNFYEFIERNKIEDLYLVLAGGVWKKFEKELNETLNQYNKNKIKVLGYVPDEDLPALYSQAQMFIYPSLYEGFGLPVLEAMQCGCPVITSNVTSLPEVIGNAGIQINPTSDDEMIKAFEKMYFDSDYKDECCKKGLARARQFSWEKCASEIIEFIKEKSA